MISPAFPGNRTADLPSGGPLRPIRQTRPAQGGAADWFAELVVTFLVCAAFSAVAAPDVNESHYLTRARSLVDPRWCAGDLYLESAPAHFLFLQAAGWMAHWTSLSAAAWAGRIAAWMLVSAAFRSLARQAGLRGLVIPAAMGLMLALVRSGNMAGEWIVGGFEAKSLAWPMVLFAWSAVLSGCWPRAWIWCGAAMSLHFLVGWWGFVAALVALLCEALKQKWSLGRLARVFCRDDSGRSIAGVDRQGVIARWLPALVLLGGALAGAVPATWHDLGVPAEDAQAAAGIQVFERLRHHLWFGGFPVGRVAAFSCLVVLWWALDRAASRSAGQTRLRRLVLASLGLGFCGLLLSGLAAAEGPGSGWAVRMLRLYWFRLEDIGIPLGISLLAGAVLVRLGLSPVQSARWLGRGLVAILLLIPVVEAAGRIADRVPPADRAGIARGEQDPERIRAVVRNWQRCCQWIHDNTPASSHFLTPWNQQTFHWYAGRPEFAVWKNAPQDARGLIAWRERMTAIGDSDWGKRLAQMPPDARRELVAWTEADYLVLWQRDAAGMAVPDWLVQVYPERATDQTGFVVWKVDRERLRAAMGGE